jgi:glycosyltransferase involved in cell wall biosynthesis
MVTTGAGLRAWSLAQGLRTQGFDVVTAMPSSVLSESAAQNPEIRSNCFERQNLTAFIQERNPDVLIVQHWGLMREIETVECPLAIDLAGPHLLERAYWGSESFESDLYEKLAALRRADFVICSGEFQRYYFLSFLALAGFLLEPHLLPVIPLSLSPELPSKPKGEPDAFIYSGMFLPWQDPSKALTWLLEVFDDQQRGSLTFCGGMHPEGDVSGGAFQALLERLERHPRVTLKGLVPYDQLLAEYQNAGVAVDLMVRNLERELAFTTRTMVYLWCGLPVIYNYYSELSGYIRHYKAGWVLSPEDEAGFKSVVKEILSQPEEVRRRGQNAQRLVRENFTWDKTIEPLANFCREPRSRPDKEAAALRFESRDLQIAQLTSELEETRSALLTLKGKKIVRFYERFGSFAFLLTPLVVLLALPICLVLGLSILLTDLLRNIRK